MKNKRLLAVMLLLTLTLAVMWHFIYKIYFLKVVYPQKYQTTVVENSDENKLSPALVYAVIKNESGFNPSAQSRIGAMGLMQLTPDTFEWAQTKIKNDASYTSQDLYDPQVNIKYGTVVLSSLLNEFGQQRTALAAYHAGRGNVKKWLGDGRYSRDGKTLSHIPFDDTRAYVEKVIQTEEIYRSLYHIK